MKTHITETRAWRMSGPGVRARIERLNPEFVEQFQRIHGVFRKRASFRRCKRNPDLFFNRMAHGLTAKEFARYERFLAVTAKPGDAP